MGQKTTKGEVFTSPYFSYVVRYARTLKKSIQLRLGFYLASLPHTHRGWGLSLFKYARRGMLTHSLLPPGRKPGQTG